MRRWMRLFQYTRLQDLLDYFLSHQGYMSPSVLTRHFQISQRTLRSDIHNLNEELSGFDAQIIMKRSQGYALEIKEGQTRALLENMLVNEEEKQLDSADKRINHIIIKMLYANTYLTQDALADEVFVSINTIINYLKTIRLILSKYQLTLQTKANLGYIVTGEEADKRRCIIDLITTNYQHYEFRFSQEQTALLNHVNLEQIKDIVMEFNRKNDLHFSDYNLKNLILHIALSISRLLVAKPIEEYAIPEHEALRTLLEPLITEIELDFQVVFTANEKNYIYSHYVSNTNELLDTQKNTEYIHNLVANILDSIFESYHFDLRSDLILEHDLTHHLQSILNARYYHLNKKNPLLNTIRNNYILAYEISGTAIKQAFANEPFELNDDEIGYISLHIGAAIERYFDSRYLKHKKAVIVYDSGYAAGSFLASKLNTLFKETLEIIGRYPSHEIEEQKLQAADIVISTVALKQTVLPVVVVDIPLSRRDIENVARAITMDEQHPIDKIAQFFDEKLFINTAADSKEEIIHTLCTLLHQEHCINDDFEASVLEREQRISTGMDGVVAIPHPLKICSLKSKIAVGVLQHPILWSDKDSAQIILLLGLADDAKKDIEKLYDTFVAMTHNAPLQELLFHARSLSEFLNILKQNLDTDAY